MATILSRPTFSIGEKSFTWQDVVLAAILRGDWMAIEQQAILGLSLVEWAEENDTSPTEEDLDAAGQEFRYERDLVTAEEMEAWLGRCGLTVEEWMDYIERSLLRQREQEGSLEDVPDDAMTEGEVGDCVVAEAICSGELARFADTLAAHAAIAERAAEDAAGQTEPSDEAELEQLVARTQRSLASSGLDLPAEASRDRIAELARLELAFRRRSQAVLTDAAIRAQVEAHRLDWIRIDVRDLGFPDEAAAKEAALCLREDGATLESVAAEAHTEVKDGHYYIDDADPDARPLLLSATPEELVGPLQFPDGFHLLYVCGKTMPSDENSEIRRRAKEALIVSISEHESQTRVRWHERL
jgi:hypothetical protein